MTNQEIQDILNKLRDGELEEYCVSKEDFMAFRKVLIEREDFKHFHGTAKRGGSIVYRYTKIQEADRCQLLNFWHIFLLKTAIKDCSLFFPYLYGIFLQFF